MPPVSAGKDKKDKTKKTDSAGDKGGGGGESGAEEGKSAEEKRKHIKSLIDKIPTQKEQLFQYKLDTAQIDGVLMEKKIRPWINKKIIEYIGEPEPTLVDFICSKVLAGSQPQGILDDVQMVSPRRSFRCRNGFLCLTLLCLCAGAGRGGGGVRGEDVAAAHLRAGGEARGAAQVTRARARACAEAPTVPERLEVLVPPCTRTETYRSICSKIACCC